MEKRGVQILGQMKPEYSSVLTPEAIAFIGHIQRKFGSRVVDLMQKRKERQARQVVMHQQCTCSTGGETCIAHSNAAGLQVRCRREARLPA